ncbi:MAG TPA: hypothetical protein VEC36_03220 [Patescibacteria group bacterium]|nr:hypothetical protein [Patescibacteria group bacterium]
MKNVLLIFLLFGVAHSLKAQKETPDRWTQLLLIPDNADAYIFDAKQDLTIPASKLIKRINIKHDFIKKTKETLIRECADSLRYYGGNCFKITYYDDIPVIFGSGQEFPDHMRGEIYALDDREMKDIRRQMKNDLLPEESSGKKTGNKRKPGDVIYDVNIVFQYGGESKFAFLFFPKINVFRKHITKTINPYYGFELGPHLHLLGGYGSISAIVGLEAGFFNVETSLSRFVATAVEATDDDYGLFRQTLWNIKAGVGIGAARLKIGRSFVQSEYVPNGQERTPFFDVGKINGHIWELNYNSC